MRNDISFSERALSSLLNPNAETDTRIRLNWRRSSPPLAGGRTRQFRWETKLRRYRNGLRSLIKLIQRARHKISRPSLVACLRPPRLKPRIAACRRFVGRATYNFASPMFNLLAVNALLMPGTFIQAFKKISRRKRDAEGIFSLWSSRRNVFRSRDVNLRSV